jgi:DNA-binding CsgD family transcriptional regulator/PAS domain-containing protein
MTVMPTTQFRNRRSLERALEFATAVHGCPDMASLQRHFLGAVGDIVEADALGFYELDRHGRPLSLATAGAPSGFLDEYEAAGRPADPLLDYVRVRQQPVHDAMLFDRRSWARQPLARLMLDWGFEHSLQGPLLVGGRVVGTLDFARTRGLKPFGEMDLVTVGWICMHMSTALQHVLTLQRSEAETHLLRSALETINVAVVITRDDGKIVKANRAAQASVLWHKHGPELKPGAGRAVAANIEQLLTSGDRIAETCLLAPADDAIEYLVKTTVSKAAGGYFFSTFLPALRTIVGSGSEAIVLSAREQQIAKLVAEGLHNEAIASRLLISVNTVKDHLKRMYRKLGVTGRAQLAAWAQRNLTQL